MEKKTLGRRSFLRFCAGAASAAFVASCAPKPAPESASEPAAPVKKTEAPAPAKTAIDLKVMVWTIADRMWMETAAEEFGDQNGDVNIIVDKVPYGDALKKTMTGLATGSLQDVFYAPVRWGKYLAYKGTCLWLDDYVKTKDPSLDDYYEWAIDGASFEGKLYGLPHEMNPGAYACCYYNKDLLAEAGVPEPTPDWTVEDFPEMAAKVQDRDKKIYGTTWIPGRFYAYSSLARSFGGRLITKDGKKWTFSTDPKSVEAARWVYDLRNKWDAGADREEMEGLSFTAGRVGFNISNIQSSGSVITGVGDKFDLGITLAPSGKTGLHGYYAFVNNMCVYGKTKHAQEAYDCVMHMTSPEVAMNAFVEQTHPSGRKSVWAAADEKGAHPIWKMVGDWMATEKAEGDMPMPYNLRFEEVVDKWSNVHHKLWYGDVSFQEGVDLIQRECATIVDLPRD